ncbi:FAD-dependent oxidoreductase [Devosia sp. MC532]|uniref:NAD(P)/FAD-dependent oxidoreductase n=1 Tax=Devosia sp. MC532 TaxID=2799788 RepID=UPI0018F6A009|nr:FAD-dependent oxidoreductase [Devosia sp. MC532]MBJ7578445.1 FAD-dependent oxidoreductase [Devosia sp. MC532]
MTQSIVIIGGGLAGYALATALRKASADIALTVISEEAYAPYDRPPLSKAVLLADEPAPPYLLPPEAWAERNIALLLDSRVAEINRAERVVVLQSGQTLAYDQLILATGGSPRRLAVPGSEHVAYLRSFEDALAIRQKLTAGSSLVCIGAGVISLELASVARDLGVHVHVVEATSSVMGRLLPAPERDFFQAVHVERDVAFHFNAGLAAIEAKEVGYQLVLADGQALEAGLIVAGIGMSPNTELATAAGLAVGRGIIVDTYGQTSDPAIYALGDVAEFFHDGSKTHAMLETWYNAMDHAAAMAKTLSGTPTVYAPTTRFWTDQFGRNFQMAGNAALATQVVEEGDRADGKFSVLYLNDDGVIVFAMSADDPRRLRMALKSIQAGEVYGDLSKAKRLNS